MFVRSGFPFNYDQEQVSEETGIDCTKAVDPLTGEVFDTPSLTKQAFAEDADVNVIVKRFGLTGQLPQGVAMPSFGDVLDAPDMLTAMQTIRSAQESFMAMPADVRARFHNDPVEFVDFCSDGRNMEEARRLGLVPPEEVRPAPAPLAGAAAPPAPTPGTPPGPAAGTIVS